MFEKTENSQEIIVSQKNQLNESSKLKKANDEKENFNQPKTKQKSKADKQKKSNAGNSNLSPLLDKKTSSSEQKKVLSKSKKTDDSALLTYVDNVLSQIRPEKKEAKENKNIIQKENKNTKQTSESNERFFSYQYSK